MRIRIPVLAMLVAAGIMFDWPAELDPRPVLSRAIAQPATKDSTKTVAELVDQEEGRLVKFFKHLHANPELGFEEVKTAELVAEEFKELGYEVHTGIGKTGVVGIMMNGPGPVVMFRGDMDGLPVKEAPGLDYAIKATATKDGGGWTPVMHACGHDAHVTYLLGVAKVMKELKAEWSGTLVLVAQPAEELILGARAMVKDGLYDKVPKPDYLVSSHVFPNQPAGSAAVRAGRRLAGTDQLDVTIYGVGGHGSMPESAKDPVVMGAMAVIGYQTIISRAIDPQEPGVITVGAFQGGDTNNVIPESVTLRVNLRWYDPKVREQMIEGIKRITDSIASAANMPKDRMPKYVMKGTSGPVVNDEEMVKRSEPLLRLVLGKDKVAAGNPPVMGSEDFQDLAHPHPTTKILWIEVGCGPADVVENIKRGVRPAANHNPKFKVELPAIAAGTKANAAVVLDLLKKK
jgi:hippurate hydrolase